MRTAAKSCNSLFWVGLGKLNLVYNSCVRASIIMVQEMRYVRNTDMKYAHTRA